MPKTSAQRVKGRYDLEEVTRRIEQLREKRGLSAKDMCTEVGMTQSDWSRKIRCERSTFSIEEIGAIADVLDAPPGWPFLDEESGEFFRSAVKMLARVQ